ncbi:MAG: hypothetical protein J3K34DRAFT_426257 [Monoraphidium minutum]|nr:MAG: hypothetical protein J3K34DRAFT_426257 [Monoraphidium minutum]
MRVTGSPGLSPRVLPPPPARARALISISYAQRAQGGRGAPPLQGATQPPAQSACPPPWRRPPSAVSAGLVFGPRHGAFVSGAPPGAAHSAPPPPVWGQLPLDLRPARASGPSPAPGPGRGPANGCRMHTARTLHPTLPYYTTYACTHRVGTR